MLSKRENDLIKYALAYKATRDGRVARSATRFDLSSNDRKAIRDLVKTFRWSRALRVGKK